MGVTYLLDTHVFLWLLGTPEKLPGPIRDELALGENRLLVSAASAMEVAIKVRLGKFESGRPLVPTWSGRLRGLVAEELPITTEHALLAGSMAWDHRDPFDRLLVAQAVIENVTLVTNDGAMAGAIGVRLMTW